jgi:hypothetical protein
MYIHVQRIRGSFRIAFTSPSLFRYLNFCMLCGDTYLERPVFSLSSQCVKWNVTIHDWVKYYILRLVTIIEEALQLTFFNFV